MGTQLSSDVRVAAQAGNVQTATVEALETRQLLSTVGYWRFENGVANAAATGTGTILDSSGHGFNGTAINGPTYNTSVPVSPIPQMGAVDKLSMSFNGTNERIAIPDNPAFQLTQSLTLEAYFNARASSKTLDYIVFRGDDRFGHDPYWIGIQKNAAGQTQVIFQICPTVGNPVTLAANISLNQWTHVAGTLDNSTGTMNLYVNGQLAATAVTTARAAGPLTGALPGLGIGNLQSANFSQYFNGLIDEVRISNTALLPDQLLNSKQTPYIGSVSASPNPLRTGAKLTLTANAVVDPFGTVTSVKFYRESNGKPGLQTGTGGDLLLGTDTSAGGGWSVSVSTAKWTPGNYTYYAQAIDSRAILSNVASAPVPLTNPPVKDYSVFWNGTYSQTSTAAPTKIVGYFFSDRAFLNNANDYDNGLLKYPGSASAVKLALVNSTLLQAQTTYLASQAALDTAFPAGSYATTVTSGVTGASQVLTMNHAQDAYSGDVPAFSAATFTGMQFLNSAAAFTFNFNSFITGTLATQSFVFLTITNASNNQTVFSQSFLNSKTTSISLPAKTLQGHTAYKVSLDFSNRIVGSTGPTRTDQGFELSTIANLSTI